MKMQQKFFSKQGKRFFFIICIVFVIAGIAYQTILTQQGYWQDDNIQIDNLTVCSGIDEVERRMISPDVVSRREYSEQFVCGRIRSRSYASLYFLYYKENFEHGTLGKWFEGEFFASPLYIKAGDPIGIYRVEIRQGRKLLGGLVYSVSGTEVKKITAEK